MTRTIVRSVVAAVIVIHGLIHLLGVFEGFGWADAERFGDPIGPGLGLLWLAAAVAVTGSAVLLAAGVRWWWALGAVAAVVSQAAILTSWSDARAGTIGNVVLAAAVIHGYLSEGPRSLRGAYRRWAAQLTGALVPSGSGGAVLHAEDLAHLPGPVAAYVIASGALGRPRPAAVRASVHGRIRSGAGDTWMTWHGEQVNTFSPSVSRVFSMDATMRGLPADVFHRYIGGQATMQVKAASLVTVAAAAGPEMDQAETVTVFNELCILAPGAIPGAPIEWTAIDEDRVRATYTNAGHTVSAELVFDDAHRLVDFISADRYRSAEGQAMVRTDWSTPLGDYRDFAGVCIASHGEGWWHLPGGPSFSYLEYNVDSLSCFAGPDADVPQHA